MPSRTLGTGNRKGTAQRPNTGHTSPRSIRLTQRRAQALQLRLAGLPFRAIAKELKCSPQTAFNYIVEVMEKTIPRESAEQLSALTLERYDRLLARFYPAALQGDMEAGKFCLKIEHQRSRLCGLYPDGRPGGVNVNVSKAEQFGVNVTIVDPKFRELPDGSEWLGDSMVTPPKVLQPPAPPIYEPAPMPAQPDPQTPPATNNVVRFDSPGAPAESAFARKRHWMD